MSILRGLVTIVYDGEEALKRLRSCAIKRSPNEIK
jgi:hypothetical protein